LKSPMSRDSEEPDGMIWEELPRNAVQPGMPPGTVVYQRLVADTPSLTQVLLVPPGESPMIPVSRERFLNAEIARYAPADSEVVRALSETAWERWVADSPRRKELRDGTVARLARTDPEAAAKLKATLEEAERDAGTRLKAMEAGEREWKDRVAAEPTIRQTLISRLESMSPAERALPAVLALEGPWVLVPPGTPDGRRLVALNPAFYRSRGNVTAVRAIGVCFEQSAPNDHHNSTGVYRAVWQVYRTLDWGALARLIER